MSLINNKNIIGLTGMSGAGKTTVSGLFVKHGFELIDCDILSRTVVEPFKPCVKEISCVFGKNVITSEGLLDRKAIADIIFSDRECRKVFNDIVYPYITFLVFERIIISENINILLDAPTLFESGINNICTKIISVFTDEEIALQRIVKRDSISYEDAKKRISSQHNKEFFIKYSDYYINNIYDDNHLRKEATKLIEELRWL